MATVPSKKEVLLDLLEKSSVLVHLDARRPDVVVPMKLKTNPQLVLQLGLNLTIPIRDLDVGDEGVKCTLSFNRTPFLCVLPYPAIFAMAAEDGTRSMVWQDDVPEVVVRAHEEDAQRESKSPPAREPRALSPTPNVLQSKRIREEPAPVRVRPEPKRVPKAAKPTPVKPPAEGGAQSRDGDSPARPKRELPPYLRVIK